MDEVENVFLKLKDWFRRNEKTNWGKNQIIEQLDIFQDQYVETKKESGGGVE